VVFARVIIVYLQLVDLLSCSSNIASEQWVRIPTVVSAAALRCTSDSKASWMLAMVLLQCAFQFCFELLMHSVRDATLTARANLQSEVHRAEKARSQLQEVNLELDSVKRAFSRLLAATCDVVFQVNGDLRIDGSTSQLHALLLPGQAGTSSDLEGRSFADFLASPQDWQRIQKVLSQHPADRDGGQVCGVAAALSIEIRDAAGSIHAVDLFCAGLGANRASSSAYVLGLRLKGEVHVQSRDAAAPVLLASLPEKDESLASSSVVSSSVFEVSRDPSLFALHFDAGSHGFAMHGFSALGGNDGRIPTPMLLGWLNEDRLVFEDWVMGEIQKAPWDQEVVSSPFPGTLTMRLPAAQERLVQVGKAWLQIQPPVDDKLPVTLWVERLSKPDSPSKACTEPALPPVAEEQDLNIHPDDSISETGLRLRHGHRGAHALQHKRLVNRLPTTTDVVQTKL